MYEIENLVFCFFGVVNPLGEKDRLHITRANQ